MQNLPLVTMLFIGVNLDFFVILLFLLQKYNFKDNLFGYALGMLLIFGISALAGQLIQSLIPAWVIGFLGLIPIYMGIKEEDHSSKTNTISKRGITAVLLMYLASCGADNIAVYVPVLATMALSDIIVTMIYFLFLTAISLTLAYFFGQLPIIKNIFEHWGTQLCRIIYVFIGLFVMLDAGLVKHIITLF
ncbi:MAG: cadmium resistance transporter [Liquorilactobacillus mali]|uniref:cadmium resistance transporter n=1 Tax=Liquorilactobacillus mali TaxID=1618 RepID=UPI0039EB85AD